MISPTERSDTMRAAGYFALASTALVCLLWLPFGFGMVGNIEEWDILSLLTRHGVFFFAGENSPLASHRLRPLTAAPNAVAYLLSPDSFFAMHLLQMGSLIIKGVAAALMGYWLLRSRLYAVLLGLLVIVLPADTMQLSFRSFHINCAVALGMAGVAGLLYAYERRELTGRGGIILALLSAVCLGIAIQIYEVALVFVPFPFLLLWARNGLRGTLRIAFAQLPVTALWSVAVAVCLGYIYTVLAHGSTYQSSVVGGQSTSVQMVKERLWVLAFTGMGRALVGGWIDAAMILMHEFRTYAYVLATGVVFRAGSVEAAWHVFVGLAQPLPLDRGKHLWPLILAPLFAFLLPASQDIVGALTRRPNPWLAGLLGLVLFALLLHMGGRDLHEFVYFKF